MKRPTSRLTFPMIGRLAELLLRTNCFLARAFRHTYAFVFLDEFQDTTRVQFDLTCTAFRGTDALLTAVGDNKQRIMGWAEALDDAFGDFAAVFPGSLHRLKMNYRSAPRLVRIQQQLIAAIDAASVSPEAADDGSTGEGECRLLVFPTAAAEAQFVAQLVADLLDDGMLSPRDVCILIKQRAELYASEVIRALGDRDILARIESEVQDLLAEPFVEVVLPFLRLLAGERRAWPEATECLVRLRHGSYDEHVMPGIEAELSRFVQQSLPPATDPANLPDLANAVVTLLGTNAITAHFPQYAQGDYFADQVAKFRDQLAKAAQGASDLLQAISRFEGADSVPIMTIHKSKGLEYHTVIFLGLEDDAFWSFHTQGAEDTCAFFVAFSRAKKLVLFTFSESRVSKENERPRHQSRQTIGVLYELLVKAGVVPETIE